MENEIPYKCFDDILAYGASQPQLRLTSDDFAMVFQNDIDNPKMVNDILIGLKLFICMPSSSYLPFVMITPLGINVSKFSNYEKFITSLDAKQKREEEIEEMEYQNLKHSIRLNKWQYRFLMFGEFSGTSTFLCLVYQFLFGTNGFLNDIFN